jgi:ribosomal-protein-alanine N-acetyltransferase
VYRNEHHGTADIGLMVGERRCWGQGYGREAWRAVLEALLEESGLRKVTGGTARPNRAMVKIMKQSGMELEAVRARQELIEGQAVDLLYYARFAQPLA